MYQNMNSNITLRCGSKEITIPKEYLPTLVKYRHRITNDVTLNVPDERALDAYFLFLMERKFKVNVFDSFKLQNKIDDPVSMYTSLARICMILEDVEIGFFVIHEVLTCLENLKPESIIEICELLANNTWCDVSSSCIEISDILSTKYTDYYINALYKSRDYARNKRLLFKCLSELNIEPGDNLIKDEYSKWLKMYKN